MKTLNFNTQIASLCLSALLLSANPAHAGEGHDHGDKPTAQAAGLPRFAATSDQYELVGVINGKTIALYLDNSASNEPVKNATLALELAGKPVTVKATGEGTFEATLAEPLKDGVTAVAATLTAGTVTDLLAGEIDIHSDAKPAEKHTGFLHTLQDYAPLIGGAIAGLLLIGFVIKKTLTFRRRKSMLFASQKNT